MRLVEARWQLYEERCHNVPSPVQGGAIACERNWRHSVPSPACGGGTGRGPNARGACHSPSPTLPRKRGREQTEFAAWSYAIARSTPSSPPTDVRKSSSRISAHDG